MDNSDSSYEKDPAAAGKKQTRFTEGQGNYSPLLKALGERIQKRRQELGLSQEEVCQRIEMNRTYLSDIERGLGNVSILLLFKLSRALQVELSSLLLYIEQEVVEHEHRG